MRLTMILGSAIALLCACGSAGGQQNQAQPGNTAASPAPSANWATPTAPVAAETSQPVAPRGPAPEVTAQWLQGRWQVGDGACTSEETQFSFGSDGRYSLGAERGRWTLTGTALTIQVTQAPDGGVAAGDSHTSQLAAIDADTAELRTDGIPPVQIHRCR